MLGKDRLTLEAGALRVSALHFLTVPVFLFLGVVTTVRNGLDTA